MILQIVLTEWGDCTVYGISHGHIEVQGCKKIIECSEINSGAFSAITFVLVYN